MPTGQLRKLHHILVSNVTVDICLNEWPYVPMYIRCTQTNRSRSSRSSWNCSSCSLHSKMISRCLLFDNDYVEVIEFILSHFYSFRINTLHQSFIITFKQQLLPQHSSNNAGGRTFYSAKEPSPRNFPIFNLHFEN